MAALDVTTVDIQLTVNNEPQPLIVADATTTTAVLPKIKPGYIVSGTATIHLADGTTRTAVLDATEAELNGALKFKVPYYYTCQKANGTIITSGEYFSRDGINLSSYMEGGVAGWQCTQDGSMHAGSHVTGVRGDITLVPYYGEGVPVLAGYIKTDLSSSTSYDIDETRTIDYSATSGITDGSMGYMIVTPLPSGTLYTETQSNSAVSWSAYNLSVTIAGTPVSVTFTPSDDKAVKIDNIPLGSSVSASASITVSGVSYSTLAAESATGTVTAGGGTLTMYARYPLTCQVSTAHMTNASISGTVPTFYTNTSPATALPSATAQYTNVSNGKIMRFIGWALQNNGTPVITGDTIPSTYKGALTLYACYGECSLTITGAALPATGSPVLASGDTLALTAVPEGFPAGQTITYSWRVLPLGSAPAAVSGSGANATVTPVAGASGIATVEVTATCGSLSASAMKNVTVVDFSVTGDTVINMSDTGKMLTVSVAGYTGTIEYTWNFSGGSVSVPNGQTGANRTFNPVSGGKTTVTVGIRLVNENITLPAKTIDIYVFDINLNGTGLTAPTPPDTNYSLMMTTNDTAGKSITASLNGSGLPAVTYEWTFGGTALNYIETDGTTGATHTITPKLAGTAAFTVKAKYNGTDVASATVDVTVAGIVLTCPKFIEMGGATSSAMPTATVQGYSGTPTNWQWSSESPGFVTIGTPSNSGSGSSVTVNAVAGGKTKIKVSADVGGTTVRAEQDIYLLNMNLAFSSGASYIQPDGLTETRYKLTLANSETTPTTVTASLAGSLTGFTFSWALPASSTKTTATSPNSNILSVKPKAGGTTGTESFTVTATCTADSTISIQKTVDVIVAGLTLTGSGTHEFINASPVPTGANDITLTLGADGVNIGDVTVVGYESSNTAVAANPTAGADGCTVTALKGGTTTITVTATANGKTLTATKTITVINLLVKDGDNNDVPATGNTLALGPVTLAAELDGIETGVTYEWTASPAGSVTFSAADAATTTAGVASTGSDVDITVTATYDGTDYTKTMSFTTIYEYAYTTASAFGTFLSGISGTSASAPLALKITGLSESDLTQLANQIRDRSVYMDLSATTLPSGITNMYDRFWNCEKMIAPPGIPNGVTNMGNCFTGCSGLKNVSSLTIPNTVTNMRQCFYNCTSLTDLSGLSIPASVEDMYVCFQGCTSLTDAPDLSACTNLTDMGRCFAGCSSLTTAPIIPAGVTDMRGCFQNCTSLSGTITINASIADASNWTDAFKNVDASKITAIYVPDPETKAALMAQNTQFSDSQVIVMN